MHLLNKLGYPPTLDVVELRIFLGFSYMPYDVCGRYQIHRQIRFISRIT